MSTELAVAFLKASTQHTDEAGAANIFDTTALRQLHSISASKGRVTAVLPVTAAVANRNSTLHGGCIATLVDTVGTAALVTVSPKGGVSLNINVNYLSKAPLGGSVLVDSRLVKAGRTIATIDVQLRDQASGALVAQGTHVKFIAPDEPTLEGVIEWLSSEERAQQTQQAQQRGTPGAPQAQGPRSKL